MESNDSPEIPDRGETSDILGLPSGAYIRAQPKIELCMHSILRIQSYETHTHSERERPTHTHSHSQSLNLHTLLYWSKANTYLANQSHILDLGKDCKTLAQSLIQVSVVSLISVTSVKCLLP